MQLGGQAREQRRPRLEGHRGEHGRALCWQPNGRAQDRLELRGRDLGDRGVQQEVAQSPMHQLDAAYARERGGASERRGSQAPADAAPFPVMS